MIEIESELNDKKIKNLENDIEELKKKKLVN